MTKENSMKKKVNVGAAFSDSVYSHTSSFIHLKRGYDGTEPQLRQSVLLLLLVVAGGILCIRLFFLQVITGQQYRLLSDSNRTKTEIVHAPRGIIFDRNGIPLVYNMPGFREIVNGKTVFLNQKAALPLMAQKGNTIEIDNLREYPLQAAAAHVVGYIGQISQDELQEPYYATYRVSDVIGKNGIEQFYENKLKGIDGRKLEEVDATGKVARTLGTTDPIPGQNITVTIASDLQEATYNAMSEVAKGAAIVSKPDGEILALVSKPSFDPNVFTMGGGYSPCHPEHLPVILNASEGSQSIERDSSAAPQNDMVGAQNDSSCGTYHAIDQVLLDNNGQPLLNRAIGGVYPPGSTFKLITAAAGLQSKQIDENYTVEDTGVVKIGAFSFANWYYTQYGKTEGQVNVVAAIKRSNDIFFYKLGELLGVDTISTEAHKYGVGTTLGIDLDGERSGLLPTKEWKQKTFNEDWYTGDDYHYAIGQGYLLTTPLQVNYWTQVIANGGIGYQPHLLKNEEIKVKSKGLLTNKSFDLIRQGMIEACNTGGVAWPLFNFSVKNQPQFTINGQDFFSVPEATGSADRIGVSIACKTGTAQHGTEETLPHAWITLFAPAYHPQVVVTVLAESSGEGSTIAGPVAKKILEAYFNE
jgi:penicillin-binding protein 2